MRKPQRPHRSPDAFSADRQTDGPNCKLITISNANQLWWRPERDARVCKEKRKDQRWAGNAQFVFHLLYQHIYMCVNLKRSIVFRMHAHENEFDMGGWCGCGCGCGNAFVVRKCNWQFHWKV